MKNKILQLWMKVFALSNIVTNTNFGRFQFRDSIMAPDGKLLEQLRDLTQVDLDSVNIESMVTPYVSLKN
jgi:hypothetical protein